MIAFICDIDALHFAINTFDWLWNLNFIAEWIFFEVLI